MLLTVCLLSFIATWFLLWRQAIKMKQLPSYKAALKIPGRHMYPIIGNLMEVVLMSPETTFKHIRKEVNQYEGNYREWILGTLHFQCARAADLELVLTHSKYVTKSALYKFLHPFMGTGLLTSTGQKWFHRRRILTPAFHFNILQDFLSIFKDESQKLVNFITPNKPTDLQKIIPRFTLNTICETAMGVKLDSLAEPDAYRSNIYKMGEWLVVRCMNPVLHADPIYKLSGLSFILNKYLNPVHTFSSEVINRRRKTFLNIKQEQESSSSQGGEQEIDLNENIYSFSSKKKKYAMLDTLFAAEANDDQIDNIGIREEVDTFMFEGYDTTSSALVFTLFMLAHHQDVQEKTYNEVLEVFGNGNNTDGLSVKDYNNMKYMDRVIKETLRLYPPVPYIGRELMDPVKLRDYELPAGTQFHIHTYDLHRDPEQFPDPEKFDVDRFLPENIDKRHPFSYIPFSAGIRNCIGQKFAVLEMKSLISNLLFNYRLEAITKVEDVMFVADIVLRTKVPIEIKFTLR